MEVKLISITQPLVKTKDESRFLTPEELIVYCARVSNPNNQLNIETAPKLLKYCIDNKHWSIFEQVDMSFEIKTSLAIAQQLTRHRSAVFQMYSARYSLPTTYEKIELRKQAKSNRQSSAEIIIDESLQKKIENHLLDSKNLYNSLVSYGVARECARFVLPVCTETTLIAKNNLRNWIHYIEVRTSEHTQKEHRQIAEKIKQIFIDNFSNISKVLNWTND